MLACCASSAIPTEYITKVCGDWSKQDYFIEHVKFGSEDSRINIPSQTRNLLTWITELFEGPNTPSEKLIDYEAVKVADGYHEIFKELFLSLKGTYLFEIYIHLYIYTVSKFLYIYLYFIIFKLLYASMCKISKSLYVFIV